MYNYEILQESMSFFSARNIAIVRKKVFSCDRKVLIMRVIILYL